MLATMESSAPAASTLPKGPMPLVVRPAVAGDLEGLYRLASVAGLTNLPADRDAMAARIAASNRAMTDHGAREQGAPLLFVVETLEPAADDEGDHIVGTACIFPKIGKEWPFYSYRVTRVNQTSKALGKSVSHDVLILANDFDDCAEVGGLFVMTGLRGMAAGKLAARSRYLFIAGHRDWFGRQVISELRGYQDENGRSPVWEALGREFYDMDFNVADHANGVTGSQFIADLAPRHPIYAGLLPADAREALGQPHPQGRRAMQMLLDEGFRADGYVDIFDGGPTLSADIGALRAVRESRRATVSRIGAVDGAADHLVCKGHGPDFRAAKGALAADGDGGVIIDYGLARALNLRAGEEILYAGF